MNEAYSITAAELAKRGKNDIPAELRSQEHLIYSSPATLAFNSPGAQGFGVKRAGLAVPGSVMLLVAPRCCGRNTSALGSTGEYADRFFYLLLDDTDIVTGRHLLRIPEAVKEICAECAGKPSAVMICITCVDALLGTDMERVCRKSAEAAGVPVVPCYMYALTREGRLPPMTSVRKSVYSLLEPAEKKADSVNLLGYFSPLVRDCELFELLHKSGIRKIREISTCRDFPEYRKMAEANFNLVLNPEARYAALDMEKRLNIPFIELARVYDPEKVRRQYRLFADAAGIQIQDEEFYQAAKAAVELFRAKFGAVSFAVGEWLNADPFELALSMIRAGFRVAEIFGTAGDANFIFIRKIAELSPDTRIYSNLSPTMLAFRGSPEEVDCAVGQDAMHYYPEKPGIRWNGEIQPFGYAGIRAFWLELCAAMEGMNR